MIEMSATQLQEHLVNSRPAPFLLDVREEWEYQYCHIENSVLIPMAKVIRDFQELNSQQEIVIICHHGIRSRQIARFLETQNFTKIINLTGGVEAWADAVDPSMPRY